MTAADRRLLESFGRALADGKLHLVYQPKVRLRDGKLTRVEALVRFIDTEDGEEALSRIKRGDMPQFQLVITDLVMPHVGGEELVASLRPAFPDVPVLVISGFDQQGSLRRMYERGHASAFLEKPFEGRSLLKLVRELLDNRLGRVRVAEKVTMA